MAKSKASFSKKEKEKKKIQKRNEKQEKREERKASSRNGNNLDEMMAYIDEFGNISSTPPDPTKKVEIKVEDIQLGASRQQQEDEDPIRQGVVTMFNDQKGYGFIRDLKTQESVFVHINALQTRIKETDKVTFEVEMGHKGLNAVNVQLLK